MQSVQISGNEAVTPPQFGKMQSRARLEPRDETNRDVLPLQTDTWARGCPEGEAPRLHAAI